MLENADANSTPSRGDDRGNSSADYLRRAVQACAAGNAVLGMHLYLAAFEKASASSGAPEEDAIDGLKQAWALACRFKERSLAEYIFETKWRGAPSSCSAWRWTSWRSSASRARTWKT